MKERRPIFYDAERVRWRRTRRVLEISGVVLTLLLVRSEEHTSELQSQSNLVCRPPASLLFPYTTLFRSHLTIEGAESRGKAPPVRSRVRRHPEELSRFNERTKADLLRRGACALAPHSACAGNQRSGAHFAAG